MHPDKNDKTSIAESRPTEVVSALAISAAVYGFCAESGVPNGVAVAVGLVCGLGPFVVSNTVDRIRG